MKKTLRLFLSAMMASSGLLAGAAPVAVEASDFPMKPNDLSIEDPLYEPLYTVPLKRILDASEMANSGIIREVSPTEEANFRALRSATAANRALSNMVQIVGQVAATGSTKVKVPNFYYLPHTSTGSWGLYGKAGGTICYNYGGIYNEEANTFRGVYANINTSYGITAGRLSTFDLSTGQEIDAVSITNDDWEMLAISCDKDPVSGMVYGVFYGQDGRSVTWGTIDYATGARTVIREIAVEDILWELGVTPDGQYYGVTDDMQLMKVDKETGAFEFVGLTNFPDDLVCGSCINPRNNTMLVISQASDGKSTSLYEIDLETGATTELCKYNFAMVMLNLHVKTPAAADKAPSAPVIEMTAPEGTHTVNYCITLPTTLFDGTPMTGSVDWVISVDGVETFEGRNQVGTKVCGTLNIETTGEHVFTAVARNEEGNSPKAEATIFVGRGLPAAPSNVSAAWADNAMTITWDPLTASSDGGYIATADVTYDLADTEGNVIATGLTETTYTYEVNVPELFQNYQYEVTAIYDGNRSDAGISNIVHLGSYVPAYSYDFTKLTKIDELYAAGFSQTGFNTKKAGLWTVGTTATSRAYGLSSAEASTTSGNLRTYLFTPELYLEAGKCYIVSVKMHNNSSRTSKNSSTFKIFCGQEKTEEGMGESLLDISINNITKAKAVTYTCMVQPETTGNYYVALMNNRGYYSASTYLMSMEIAAGVNATAPGKPAAFELNPDTTGELMVKGNVTAPTTTLMGVELDPSTMVDFRIEREGQTVATTRAYPGQVASFTDSSVPVKGDYLYTAIPVIDGNDGERFEQAVYVGPYAPKAPTGVTIVESYQPGTVTLTWIPPTEDVQGNKLLAKNLTYQIYELNGTKEVRPMLATPTSSNTATFQAIEDPSKQTFLQYSVRAINHDEESTSRFITSLIPVGNPSTMPVCYSKTEDLNTNLMGYTSTYVVTDSRGPRYATLTVVPHSKFDIPGIDDDDEYLLCTHNSTSDWVNFYTGKIDLTTTERPELSFYHYKIAPADINSIEVSIKVDGQEKLLKEIDNTTLEPRKWHHLRLDLSEYKGKIAQIFIRSVCHSHAYCLFDKIEIKERYDHDLEATSIYAPTSVGPYENFDLRVNIENNGYEDAAPFTVDLYRDGEVVETRELSGLEAGERMQVVFENMISYFDADNTQALFSAVVNYADKDEANNATNEITVSRPVSTLPQVSDLEAVLTDEGTVLTWTSFPWEDRQMVAETESFEHYYGLNDDCANFTYPNWTLLDVDGYKVGGSDIPGIGNGKIPCGFYVHFYNVSPLSGDYPNNGRYVLAAETYKYYGLPDDWAISPLLPGIAQTISFYARSYNANYPESFEVLYTDKNSVSPADYIQLDSWVDIGKEWEKYEVDLPAGAKHFAIRTISDKGWFFFVDDVTFIADPYYDTFQIQGYDVYRDGEKIGYSVRNAGTFTDTAMPEGNHTYHVVADFKEGPSELSNPASVFLSALEAINANGVKVSVEDGSIVVAGAAGKLVNIVSVDGRVIYSAEGDARIAVAPAIYLVTVDNTTYKLIAK